MIVFSYPINLTGRQLNTAIKDELQHFSEVPFADAQNPAWKPGLRRNVPKFSALGLDTSQRFHDKVDPEFGEGNDHSVESSPSPDFAKVDK